MREIPAQHRSLQNQPQSFDCSRKGFRRNILIFCIPRTEPIHLLSSPQSTAPLNRLLTPEVDWSVCGAMSLILSAPGRLCGNTAAVGLPTGAERPRAPPLASSSSRSRSSSSSSHGSHAQQGEGDVGLRHPVPPRKGELVQVGVAGRL
eukprot:COSAG02_NODE_1047_length_14982_cov_4.007929_7_plen_148_part_00